MNSQQSRAHKHLAEIRHRRKRLAEMKAMREDPVKLCEFVYRPSTRIDMIIIDDVMELEQFTPERSAKLREWYQTYLARRGAR